jgi:hypothetical protein
MTYTCPNDPDHQSDNPDSCSVCGARISPNPSPAAAVPTLEPIEITAIGNSVLVAGSSSAVLVTDAEKVDHLLPPTPAPAPEPPVPPRTRLELVAVVDPTLYIQPQPPTPCPVGEPPKRFSLDQSENLIGRRSERRGIFPQISLTDPGVSHKHAVILREPDGSLILMDVGSANGTQLNGKDVKPGVRIPLCGGDQIVIGCWTRITLQTVEA